eukprot:scaffold26833_cov168-Amphora_coffeaeformis.AAC.1
MDCVMGLGIVDTIINESCVAKREEDAFTDAAPDKCVYAEFIGAQAAKDITRSLGAVEGSERG